MKIISDMGTSGYRAFLIDDEGNKCFFKEINDEEIFRELLAQEIATLLGIEHITYTPYVLNGRKGVISPSFVKENNKYVTGYDLLSKYIDKTKLNNPDLLYDRKTTDGVVLLKTGQDLYIAWQAMEDKFKSYPKYENQIKEFMDNLITMMIFDLLTINRDRHGDNWIIEYNDTSFRLCSIFDNDLSFSTMFSSRLNTAKDAIPNDEALKLLLNESEDYIYQQFVNLSHIVNPDNIATIIDKAIKKYNFDISHITTKKDDSDTSENLKTTIVNNFTENYRKLEEVVNSHRERLASPTK